jgi:RNA polymerase sigma factor (TIGR02999 family)
MRAEGIRHTLTPTALVHEAYVRLSGSDKLSFQNRAHFFALAARAMRHVLVDYARAREAIRRGGDNVKDSLDHLQIPLPEPDENIINLDEALERPSQFSPRQCHVVELRYFVGFSEDETAEALGVSRRTVDRASKLVRAWLYSQVSARISHSGHGFQSSFIVGSRYRILRVTS